MAIRSVPATQWNATISDVTIESEATPIVLEKAKYGSLPADIDAFVKSTGFQQVLQGLPTTGALNIRVVIDGNRLTVINLSDNNKELLKTDSDAPEGAQFKQTTEKISTFATAYIRSITPTTTPAPCTSSPSPLALRVTTISDDDSQALCAEYEVHGIENDSQYCYANSAYQLLSNVGSLRTSVMNQLPVPLAPLKDYNKIKTGEELLDIVHGINLDFRHGIQYDAGDILHLFTSQSSNFATPITSTQIQWHPSEGPFQLPSKSEITDSIHLILPGTPTTPGNINFQEALKLSLPKQPNNHSDPIIPLDTVVSSKTQFTQAPKHLFVRVGRYATPGQKDSRLIDNPETLDLNACSGMEDGVQAKSLYLKGFTIHRGDFRRGHYIAYFQKPHPRDPTKSQWFEANDNAVRAITEKEAFQFAHHASDLYYDDKAPTAALVRPAALTTTITAAASIIDDDEGHFETPPSSPISPPSIHESIALSNPISADQADIRKCLEYIEKNLRNPTTPLSTDEQFSLFAAYNNLDSEEQHEIYSSMIKTIPKEGLLSRAGTAFTNALASHFTADQDDETGFSEDLRAFAFIEENKDSIEFIKSLKPILERKFTLLAVTA